MVAAPDAGDSNGAGGFSAQAVQAFDQTRNSCVVGLRVIGNAREQAGFGQVGGNDVRTRTQPVHQLTHLGGIGLVDFAVVAHHRVDEHKRPGLAADERKHGADLPCTPEEAAVDRVEADVLGAP